MINHYGFTKSKQEFKSKNKANEFLKLKQGAEYKIKMK